MVTPVLCVLMTPLFSLPQGELIFYSGFGCSYLQELLNLHVLQRPICIPNPYWVYVLDGISPKELETRVWVLVVKTLGTYPESSQKGLRNHSGILKQNSTLCDWSLVPVENSGRHHCSRLLCFLLWRNGGTAIFILHLSLHNACFWRY